MKSLVKYLLIAIVAITLIPVSSCKKGPNDPFLSFRSRAARLEGKWTLSSSSYKIVDVKGNTTTTKDYSYDGTKMSFTITTKTGNLQPVVITDSYLYSETWTVDKDNTYSKAKIEDAEASSEIGSWAFMNKDKDAALKNKEAVVLLPTKFVDQNGVSLNGKTDASEILVLDELRNKKVVITINELSDQSQPNQINTKTRVGTSTYIQ
jgi:hypothetical protein